MIFGILAIWGLLMLISTQSTSSICKKGPAYTDKEELEKRDTTLLKTERFVAEDKEESE
jgi:hypothetical protein